MKKLLFLFITTSLLFSCESNDDDTTNGLDPIIGSWQLISDTENGTELSNECSRKSTITFLENQTYTQSSFFIEEDCVNFTDSGRWRNDGNSFYSVDFGEENAESQKVTFSNNNSQFSISETDDGFVYVITFRKI